MIVKLLTEHHLEFLSIKGGCPGTSESEHVKMPHCWKSHALAHMIHVRLFYCLVLSLDLHVPVIFEPVHVISNNFTF